MHSGYGLHEMRGRVVAKVGAHIADPEPLACAERVMNYVSPEPYSKINLHDSRAGFPVVTVLDQNCDRSMVYSWYMGPLPIDLLFIGINRSFK